MEIRAFCPHIGGGVEHHVCREASRTPIDRQAILLSPLADIGRSARDAPARPGSGGHGRRLVDAPVAHHCPDHARHLRRQRHRRLVGTRPRRQSRSHCPSSVSLCRSIGIPARAPGMSVLRRYLLPRLVVPTRRGFSPVVTCRGTRPTEAGMSRPWAKLATSPMAEVSAVAPMPGMVTGFARSSSVKAVGSL